MQNLLEGLTAAAFFIWILLIYIAWARGWNGWSLLPPFAEALVIVFDMFLHMPLLERFPSAIPWLFLTFDFLPYAVP